MNIEISLCISFYNNIPWLEMIFEALKKQTFSNFEVIIADDGSNTETVSLLNDLIKKQPFKITHLWHSDNGFRKNIILNRAIEISKSAYLVFIDGDCIPHHKFLEEHYKYRKLNRIVSGRRVELPKKYSNTLTTQKIKSKTFILNLLYHTIIQTFCNKTRHAENIIRITNPILRKIFLKQRCKNVLGCNFGVYKSDILKINGFDERYINPGTGEDTDIEYRLQRIGVTPIVIKHLLTVYHRNHSRLNIQNKPNQLIFDDNNKNKISWTPFGIIKNEINIS